MSGKQVPAWVTALLPPNSHRRQVARIVSGTARRPGDWQRLASPTNIANFFKYRGIAFRCPVCGEESSPVYDFPDLSLRREHRIGVLRETLQCRACYASMRQRALASELLAQVGSRTGNPATSVAALAVAGLRGLQVLDTDSFSATCARLRGTAGYRTCSFQPDRAWGAEVAPSHFNIDLQRIDFPDATFDILLSSDVLEHVRDATAAFSEIHRVLKPGGVHVFTVPYDPSSAENIRLVDTSGPVDVMLCRPHLHGDPLSAGVLAYRVFGRRLITDLDRCGFDTTFKTVDDSAALIVGGDVFVSSKRSAAA